MRDSASNALEEADVSDVCIDLLDSVGLSLACLKKGMKYTELLLSMLKPLEVAETTSLWPSAICMN